MLKTEVQTLSKDSYNIQVNIAQQGYDQIFSKKLHELTNSVNLPGFRSGKAPVKMLKKQFGPKLHQDTINELVSKHYAEVFEQTGLVPALEPKFDFPDEQPESGCSFSLKVVTWPQDIDVSDLASLELNQLNIQLEDQDVEDEVQRLMHKGYEFNTVEDHQAKTGDKMNIDFIGRVDGEIFEGNSGEKVDLTIGEGQFVPGFEDQLIGLKAGDKTTLNVTFPEDYGFEKLKGKDATFDVVVHSIEAATFPADEKKLAELMQVEDEAALRVEIKSMLQKNTNKQCFEVNRQHAFETLMSHYEVNVADEIIRHDMREGMKSAAKKMRDQGVDTTPEMFQDEQMQSEARSQAEYGIKLSLLLQKIAADADISVSNEDLNHALEEEASQYPESIREVLLGMLRENEDKVAEVKNKLQERKVVEYIFAQAKTTLENKTLSEVLSPEPEKENNSES